jgi:hypothetical protein
MTRIKNILLKLRFKRSILLYLIFFVALSYTPVLAAINLDDREDFKQALDQENMALEGFITHTGNNLLLSTNCFIAGGCNLDCPEGQSVCQKDQGAIGTAGSMISLVIAKPPISNVEYFADVYNKINPIKKVYAQSVGFRALYPILSLWKISRNVCYAFFIIVFLVIGFLILFRSKINPQTVISIENSLPKIVVALLLVTFSYSIVALFIDISELLIYFIAGIYINYTTMGGTPPNVVGYVQTIREPNSIFSLMSSLNSTTPLVQAINQTIGSLAGGLINALRTLNITTALGELILNIALISALFRTFFGLISAYVNIVLQAIFSPFTFLFGSISVKGGFGEWVKDILANVLVFPATFAILLLGAIILDRSGSIWNILGGQVDFDSNGWVPFGFGGIGASTVGELLRSILAFGIILTTPTIPNMIKQTLERKPGIGEGATEGLKGAVGNLPFIGQFLR